jgi:hypothetical protein
MAIVPGARIAGNDAIGADPRNRDRQAAPASNVPSRLVSRLMRTAVRSPLAEGWASTSSKVAVFWQAISG